MLVFKNNDIFDQKVEDLSSFFDEGDLMVFNSTKVIKAKLSGKISRNSSILEFNLDQQVSNSQNKVVWSALCKPAKKAQEGDLIEIADDFFVKIIEKTDDGFIKIQFDCKEEELFQNLEKHGSVPLPPYIKRDIDNSPEDQNNYQTIYAKTGCAVAAPTSGFHFNKKIFETLKSKGVVVDFLNLDIGAGTFLPVRSEKISDHKMHSENFCLNEENCELVNDAKKNGKRIIAVGTTSLRALESAVDENGILRPQKRSTNIFIYPPYEFKIVDVLMTNFHLPKSTLFMLVCAFVGYENAFRIYNYAIQNRYRFYSYGDSSLLFNEAK